MRLPSYENSLKYFLDNCGDFGDKIKKDYIGDVPLNYVYRSGTLRLKLKCSNCGEIYYKDPEHIIRKQGCPNCNQRNNNINTIAMDSKRRLINSFPDIASEYCDDINDTPIEDILSHSNKKVWWKCKECGKLWQAYVTNRTSKGSGCPFCSKGNNGSLMEYALYLVIKEKYEQALYQFKAPNGMSFDIGVKELALVIEYNGRYYHSNKYVNNYDVEDRDKKKREYLEKIDELTFITVNETYGGKEIERINNDIYFNADNHNMYKSLNNIINEINIILNTTFTVRDDIENYSIKNMSIKNVTDSLGEQFPDLVKEWNTEKNGLLTPYKLKPQSNKKVWWKCSKCGYEWVTSPSHRVVDKTGCPRCVALKGSGAGTHMIIPGINDLKTLRPSIASEYASDLNNIPLDKIALQSNRNVFWRCNSCGNIYQDKVVYRTMRNHGCPICKERLKRKFY